MSNTPKPLDFSQEELESSAHYRMNISKSCKVVLTHNCYYDSKEPYQTWIVVTRNEVNKLYSITRFFKLGKRIETSLDVYEQPAEEIFKLLLSNYSSGLK